MPSTNPSPSHQFAVSNEAERIAETGADLVVRELERAGVARVFAYPGTSELSLCDAIEASRSIELVNARGDREAAFMAAGANLIAPSIAAALLHGARGLTNALGAIADVRRSEIPVLYIVGMASRASAPYLPPHAEPDLIGAAGSFAKASFDCSSVATAPELADILAQASRCLRTAPFGPVLVGLPQDVLTTALRGEVSAAPMVSSRPRTPSHELLAPAVAALMGARSPVVFVDDYLFKPGAASCGAVGAFASALSAPLFQVAYRRGPMLFQQLRSDVAPTYMGPYHADSPEHVAVMESADLLVTVEGRNMYRRLVGELPPCPKIAITSHVDRARKNGYLTSDDIVLEGDVEATLGGLHQAVTSAGRPATRVPPRSAEIAAPPSPPSAVALVQALAKGLEPFENAAIVDDSQMFGGLIARHYDALPAVRVFGSHGGFVGGGAATAVGAASAGFDRAIVCTLGDHGFTNGVQALASVAAARSPLLFLVCNNGSSVSLRKQARADGLARSADGAFLDNSTDHDYVAIARGFGLRALTIRWPGPDVNGKALSAASRLLVDAVREALGSRRPTLVELVVSDSPSFWTGVWNVAGFDETR